MPSRRLAFRFVSLLILALALWLRVTALYSLPVFVDEANHLLWTQRFSTGNTVYPWFMDGKFLMGVIVAGFHPLGPSPLWVARVAVGLVSVLSVAACILGGSLLGSRKAGLLAGLLYALMPYAVFHERQLLADPIMSTFGAMALVFTLQQYQASTDSRSAARPRPGGLLAPALALAAAFLSKFFGGLYAVFPLLAAGGQWGARRVNESAAHTLRARILPQLTAILLAALMALLFIFFMRPRLGYDDQTLTGQQVGFLGCPPLLCQGDLPAQAQTLTQAVRTLLELVPPYFGWPLVALALAAPFLVRRRGAAWLMLLGTLAMLLAFVVTARSIPPRYVAFLAVPIATLGACSLTALAARAGRAAPILLLAVLWPFAGTPLLVLHPTRAALADLDRQQYVTQASSGGGVAEAAMEVARRDSDPARPPVVLLDPQGGVYGNSVAAYLDRTRIDLRGAGEAYPRDLGGWLLNGQSIYLIEEGEAGVPGLRFEALGRWPRMAGAGTVGLFRVTGVDSAVREKIFDEFFLRPETLPGEYAALLDSIPVEAPALLLVYPPTQARALAPLSAASRPGLSVVPVGDSWPLDATALDAELERVTRGQGEVRVALLEETRGDPGRRIETWLNTRLFKAGEQWFGPVRVAVYGGPASGGVATPAGVRFGDGLVLESVEVFDPAPRPGGLVRLRLRWRAEAPTGQQLKIFTHLFAGEATAAQHDGQPVGELRPTHTWHAGETIEDAFALRLPAGIAPGVYQLRIGMYDLSTQARLPALLPDGSTGEFFVGGEVVIR